jgi:hypothetical protein
LAYANDNPRILILDIETKLIPLLAFGIRDQYIDLKQIVDIRDSARLIHCIGVKWLGERKVTMLTEWGDGYAQMIERTRDMLDQADAVVGFNHENFDMAKMRGQFALLGMDYPKPPTNIDIFKTVRKMGFPSSKLDYIAQAFGIGSEGQASRLRDVAGRAERLSQGPAKKMATYCAGDVRLTELVYNRLRPYLDNYPHLKDNPGNNCAKCGSANVTSQGWKRTVHFRVQSLKCGDCGGWGQGKREKVA